MHLIAKDLTIENFAPYGQVIGIKDSSVDNWPINNGATHRWHKMAQVDVEKEPAVISIFESVTLADNPYEFYLVENHPMGSQAFIPLAGQELIVVVGTSPKKLEAFKCNGLGVNIAKGIWHATLIAPQAGDYLIIDRDMPNDNCEVVELLGKVSW